MISAAALVLACLAILAASYGYFKYRTLVNPLTIGALYEVGFVTLLSASSVFWVNGLTKGARDAAFSKTLWISAVFLVAQMAPFFSRRRVGIGCFRKLLNSLNLGTGLNGPRFEWWKMGMLALALCVAFVCLAVAGGGGLLWISDTRTAYQYHRVGAGQFYAAVQWIITFAFLYALWCVPRRALAIFSILVPFGALALFTGSKANVLTLAVISVVFWDQKVSKIRPIGYLTILIVFVVLFALLQSVVWNVGEEEIPAWVKLWLYWNYFETTYLFIERFDEIGYQWGGAMISGLWAFVPRAMVPSKPFEYGVLIVHRILYPGMAEQTHTPGYLAWMPAYLDFGILGVMVCGLFIGVVKRLAYESFIENSRNLFAFSLMMQLSIWKIWYFAPFPVVLCVLWIQSLFFRLSVRRRGDVSAEFQRYQEQP